MRSRLWPFLLASMLILGACGGDESGVTGDTTGATAEAPDESTEESDDANEQQVDNPCGLATADEATALAGYELELGEASFPGGCLFEEPGSDIADISILALEVDGDAATVASNGYPNAAQIIPVDVGEDTVAVTDPNDEVVSAIVTRSGGDFIEMVMVFVGIDPTDMARIEAAAELAVTALGRWE